jgi:hypothetical protein
MHTLDPYKAESYEAIHVLETYSSNSEKWGTVHPKWIDDESFSEKCVTFDETLTPNQIIPNKFLAG